MASLQSDCLLFSVRKAAFCMNRGVVRRVDKNGRAFISEVERHMQGGMDIYVRLPSVG